MKGVTSRAATTTPDRDPRRPWVPTPFTRLARTHAFSVAGDTLFTAAMAGTVFFSVADFDAARTRVALLLLFTIAPFAVAAPLLGPLIDRARGGRRWMILGIAVARALLCVLIIFHRDLWLFYVEALLFLVLSRGYLIARGAIVPTTVRNDAELVAANSRLALLSGVTAAITALPAVLMLWLGGAPLLLGVATFVFIGAAITAAQLPPARVATGPPDAVERAELRSVGILVAASSMATVRFIVGFLVFQIGFFAKEAEQGLLIVAAAVGAQIGFLGGSLLSPVLRRSFSEERILAISLSATVASGLVAAFIGLAGAGNAVVVGLAATVLSAGVGATSNIGKQAFDAIVQRDAPDANRGRSFARFETRFQLVWVLGALVPTVFTMSLELAFVAVSAVGSFALLSYLVGRRRAAAGEDHRLVRLPPTAARWAPRAVWARRRSGEQPERTDLAVTARRRARRTRVPLPPVVPPRAAPPSPAEVGGLGLSAGEEQPTVSEGPPLFGGGPGPVRTPELDPRRLLDPTLGGAEVGVTSRRDLGFLEASAGGATVPGQSPEATSPQGAAAGSPSTATAAAPGRRRRRRRRGADRTAPLPGFEDVPPVE